MDIISQIRWDEFFYASLTVFFTVGLIIIVKMFGEIPTSLLTVGTELNLLTYGFLWDTCIEALRGREFWTHFTLNSTFLTKPVVLLLIFVGNFLIMSWNMKLESIINNRTSVNVKPARVTNSVLKPAITSLGVFSLFVFLFLSSAWS